MICALLALAALTAPGPADIALGSSVAQAVKALGEPEIRNTSVGHVWTFAEKGKTVRLTSDDDGNVQMIDVSAQNSASNRFSVPQTGVTLTFGVSKAEDVRAQLSNMADFATTAKDDTGKITAIAQGYRIDAASELVLLYDPATTALQEAFFGARSQLARAGLISGLRPSEDFHPAELQNLGAVDYTSRNQGVAYVRIEVGSDGKPRGATVFVSSGDEFLDRTAVASAMRNTFAPATLHGRPVASVYFFRENFVHAQ